MVTLSQAELSVIVGDRVPAAIEIANPGEVDDEYVVEVHGEAAQWTSVEPAQLALAAGAAATVQLWFQPVASASPGAVPFEVSVRSRQLPDQTVVLTGAVEVEATEPPPPFTPEPPRPVTPEPPRPVTPEPPRPVTPEPPRPVTPEPPPPGVREAPPTYSRYGRRAGPSLVLPLLILAIGAVLLFASSAAEENNVELADDMRGVGTFLIVLAVVAGIISLAVSRAGRR
jgi:hypothetical protein